MGACLIKEIHQHVFICHLFLFYNFQLSLSQHVLWIGRLMFLMTEKDLSNVKFEKNIQILKFKITSKPI